MPVDDRSGLTRTSASAPRRSTRWRPSLARLLPPSIHQEGGDRRALARTFGIALVIRLILMPIACHGDLLSTYHRSYVALHALRPRSWVPHELLQAAFLTVYDLFLPLPELIGWEGASSTTREFWIGTFAHHPLALPTLFLFKLPYLLCDFATALVLLHFFAADPRKGRKAVALWLFNPITLFIFYVFGRYDVIAILFIALSLLFVQRQKPFRGALAFGVAIWSRYYPALLLPALVTTYPTSWRKRAWMFGIGVAPMVAYNFAPLLQGRGMRPPSVGILRSRFGSFLLRFYLDMGNHQVLFVFPIVFTFLLALILILPVRGKPTTRFCELAVCILAMFYATVFFHPQYFSWVILFIVILRVESGDAVLRNLYYCLVLLFIPYTFYWREETWGLLFAPLDPEFFTRLQSPWVWMQAYAAPEIVVNLFRTALSAICLFLTAWILLDGKSRLARSA